MGSHAPVRFVCEVCMAHRARLVFALWAGVLVLVHESRCLMPIFSLALKVVASSDAGHPLSCSRPIAGNATELSHAFYSWGSQLTQHLYCVLVCVLVLVHCIGSHLIQRLYGVLVRVLPYCSPSFYISLTRALTQRVSSIM